MINYHTMETRSYLKLTMPSTEYLADTKNIVVFSDTESLTMIRGTQTQAVT
jgi:hypothetical protein